MKLQLSDTQVVAQVGNGAQDHQLWRNTGEIKEVLPVYVITDKAPGGHSCSTRL
jgi:hypothetical protein